MVGLFGLYFIIFIIGIAFNIINNILISYYGMYVKHLRAILIDRALCKYFYYYYYSDYYNCSFFDTTSFKHLYYFIAIICDIYNGS